MFKMNKTHENKFKLFLDDSTQDSVGILKFFEKFLLFDL